MGTSISLYTQELQPHPTWDSLPAGARDLMDADLPLVWSSGDWRQDSMCRPADFEVWRSWIRDNMLDLNMSHWIDMIELLESDPRWWIHVSY